MAISEKEFKQMQKDIREIKRQLARRKPKRRNGTRRRARPELRRSTPSEQSQVLEILRQKGMLAELPPEAKARAAEWRALPEEEKKRILDEFYNLPLEKSLSDIIIENRR